MKKCCLLTIGISASGKTTWTEEFIRFKAQDDEKWININRDQVRAEIYQIKTGLTNFNWTTWKRKWEKEATERWEQYIQHVIRTENADGVVISDTNLNPKTRNKIIKTFEDIGWDIELKFFPIEYEVAVKRDLARPNPVGSSVIAEQLEKWWEQFGERYVADTTLPKAVIVDVDGTLAHAENRNIFDWYTVDTDTPDEMVCAVVKGLKAQGFKIVITSGRDEVSLYATWVWLTRHLGFEPDELLMRKYKDMRKDTVVKRELFDNNIRDKYNVVLAIDDRPVVVRLWRSLGIKTLACGFQHREF